MTNTEKTICTNCGASNSSNQKYCMSCGYELPKANTEIPSRTTEQINGQTKEYNFEYTDQQYLMKLLALILVPFVMLLFSALWLQDYFGLGAIIPAFVIPFLIYWFNRKNIKKKGQAILSEASVDIDLLDGNHKINFNEIKSYQVDYMNGVTLKILFTNQNKLKLIANNNFCNEEQFEVFCDEFEKAITNFKNEKQSELIRTKSLYEKSWMYFVLVGMSIIAAAVFFWADKEGRNIPGSMWVALGSIAAMWAAYYKSKSKGKIKENKVLAVTKSSFSKIWNYCFDKWLLPIVFSIFTFGILFLFVYLSASETSSYVAASFFFLSFVIVAISAIYQLLKQRWMRGILTILFLIVAITLIILSYNAET